MKIKCTDLKQHDIVIFKMYSDTLQEETFMDGSVIAVYDDRKEVDVCWLEGYKSRVDYIPFEKVCARYNPKGECMKFGIFSGNSDVIEH